MLSTVQARGVRGTSVVALASLGLIGLFAFPDFSGDTASRAAAERSTPHLLTNERAHVDPSSGAPRDHYWIATSGSLFRDGRADWTGPVDGQMPDRFSRRHTGSAVFRIVTRRNDYQNSSVRLRLKVSKLMTTQRTPAQDYDGVHVFVRYRSAQHLYAVSVMRRDGRVAIKKKVPGGSSNGGSYATLAAGVHPVSRRHWHHVVVSATNTTKSSVVLTLRMDGRRLLKVTDTGQLGPPIRSGGRVGIRGDNTNFRFRGFTVRPS